MWPSNASEPEELTMAVDWGPSETGDLYRHVAKDCLKQQNPSDIKDEDVRGWNAACQWLNLFFTTCAYQADANRFEPRSPPVKKPQSYYWDDDE